MLREHGTLRKPSTQAMGKKHRILVDISVKRDRRPAARQTSQHGKVQRCDGHLPKAEMKSVGGGPPSLRKRLEHISAPLDLANNCHKVPKPGRVHPLSDRLR